MRSIPIYLYDDSVHDIVRAGTKYYLVKDKQKAATPKTVKVAGKPKIVAPSPACRQPKRKPKIDGVVRQALLTATKAQLRRLYDCPQLTAAERRMVFESIMSGKRYTQIPL